MKRSIPLVSLTFSLLALTGCFGDNTVEPIYEIPDEEFVVVFPAAEPGSSNGWNSAIGHRVSEATTRRLESFGEFLTVPYSDVIELMYAEPNEESSEGKKSDDGSVGLDVSKITPLKLAELTGADWVITIDLLHFQEKDPKNINMSRASGSADVKLFRVARSKTQRKKAKEVNERVRKRNRVREQLGLKPIGETPDGGKWVAEKTIKAAYPKDFFGQYGESFLDPVEARKGLIESIGRKVAELFYEHEEEKMPGSGN